MKVAQHVVNWNFPVAPTNLQESHSFLPIDDKVATGATWLGDHGVAMELCKVKFVHQLDFPQGTGKGTVMPGGYVIDWTLATAANDSSHSLWYNTWVSIGEGHSRLGNGNDDITGIVLGEAQVTTTLVMIATSKNVRTLETTEQGLEWDLTDGAGNGRLIVAPLLDISGQCSWRGDLYDRDSYPKRLNPPFGLCNVNSGGVITGNPRTLVYLFYKMKRINVQEWMSLAQEQTVRPKIQ